MFAYNPGEYNHNLDKILRCNSKCDPTSQLPRPFPMFTEEKAYINDKMNKTIANYLQCLDIVGITKGDVGSNLTRVTWDNLEDTKR